MKGARSSWNILRGARYTILGTPGLELRVQNALSHGICTEQFNSAGPFFENVGIRYSFLTRVAPIGLIASEIPVCVSVSRTGRRTVLLRIYIVQSLSVVFWLSCLPLDPKLTGSHPAKGDGFLGNCSTISFGGEVKSAVPCKILRHVKDPYRLKVDKIHRHFTPSLSCFVTRCLLITAIDPLWVNQEWLELMWGSTVD
jgi:hypothetical protein